MADIDPLQFRWGISYLICGILCLVIGIMYSIFIIKDIRSVTPKLPGYKISQIFFIIACCLRGAGWTIHSLVSRFSSQNLQLVSALTIGLPGYILTISYVLFFYLWSSICVNLILNDSTTGFKRNFKKIVNLAVGIIVFLGVILMILILIELIMNDKKHDNFMLWVHFVESVIAILRDFIICSIILIETLKLINMSEKPFFSFRFNESVYCWMLIYVVIALYIRAFSIIMYQVIVFDKSTQSLADYFNTFITAVLSEIVPCFMILLNRRRSGLLSVYDLLE